jgi:hypothetical protein
MHDYHFLHQANRKTICLRAFHLEGARLDKELVARFLDDNFSGARNLLPGAKEYLMPLITCPDCGRAVSDQAAVCPQCNRPIAAVATPTAIVQPVVEVSRRREIRPIGLALGLILLGAGVWMIVTMGDFPPRGEKIWAGLFCVSGIIQLATGSYRWV